MLSLRTSLALASVLLLLYFSCTNLLELEDFESFQILDTIIYGEDDSFGEIEELVNTDKNGSSNGSNSLVKGVESPSTLTGDILASSTVSSVAKIESSPPGRIGIVSMLYGEHTEYYQRCLDSHQKYAERHGYGLYILRRELVQGIWSKLAYLLNILTEELEKEPEDRHEWLMWVDADSLVINPLIPIEIVLPPKTFPETHILASRDFNGFNAGMFFIRVHPKSVTLINKALAFPEFRPDYPLDFLEQTALYVLYGEPEFRPHVIYEPHVWFNAYEWDNGYEGHPGSVFVHFAGLDDRWEHMSRWFEIIDGPQRDEWEKPLEETSYPTEIEQFWSVLTAGESALTSAAKHYSDKSIDIPEDVNKAMEHLWEVLWNDTDHVEVVTQATEELQKKMKIENP